MAGLRPTFHFVGGKGGVGKTTCAAAFGLRAASTGQRVLVASTDPAPSLADAFDVRLSVRPRAVAKDRLFAVEIGAAGGLRRWLAQCRPVLEAIALQGTWLDADDVSALLAQSIPGLDELAGLFEITRLADTDRFDHIVVDTAPTGHTLRMLALPQTLDGVATAFEAMRRKGRLVEQALRGRVADRAEDVLIRELAAMSTSMSSLLRDPDRTSVSWVTLPEPAAVAESNRAMAGLAHLGIPVHRGIVNRVTPAPPGPCDRCRARRGFEQQAIATLNTCPVMAQVAARATEPRGSRALRAIGTELGRPHRPLPAVRSTRRWSADLDGPAFDAADCVDDRTRLVLVGGKGGVGKSTAAIGIALGAAERAPNRRVLLVSSDPAHSLGDLLGVSLSDTAVRLPDAPANLQVRELDAGRALSRLRETYATAIEKLFDRLVSSVADHGHDRAVMLRLLDLAPPGLDEIASVLEISESIAGDETPAGELDLLIMDTAPTGHALRLLEMPALLHDWIHALMTILLKYRQVTGLGEIGTLLLGLARQVGRLRQLLHDPVRTRFVVVSRAATLPRLESERLLARLRKLGVSAPFVLVNAVGAGRCRRCRMQSASERREIAALGARLRKVRLRPALLLASAEVPSPSGTTSISAWAHRWRLQSSR